MAKSGFSMVVCDGCGAVRVRACWCRWWWVVDDEEQCSRVGVAVCRGVGCMSVVRAIVGL